MRTNESAAMTDETLKRIEDDPGRYPLEVRQLVAEVRRLRASLKLAREWIEQCPECSAAAKELPRA